MHTNLRVFTLLAAIAWLSPAPRAAARDLPSPLNDYRITSWVGGDGITLGEVRSLVQDRDGYLWLACEMGLVRFDGFHFATADIVSGATRLPRAATRAVHVARDGSLWVGYGDGLGVYRIVNGGVRDVHLRNTLTGFVNVITEDRTGAIWVGHDGGLSRLVDGRWEQISLPLSKRRLRVSDIHEDRAGNLWVATWDGLYRRPSAGGPFERTPHIEGIVHGITEDAAGGVWATDERIGFRRADVPDRMHPLVARGMDVFHDSRGNLWVTTVGQGIWQLRNLQRNETAPTVKRATVQTGLVNDENSDILEDREGNIWVGSIQGLTRLTPEKMASIVDIGVVRALTIGKDGTAWAGTTTGLIALTGVTPYSPGTSRVVAPVAIRALHTGADGTVWAATGEGLARIAGGHLAPVSLRGPPLRRITSIASDRLGVLWVCDEAAGLLRIANGRLDRDVAATEGTAARPIFTHVDDTNRLWIAFEGGTVRSIDRDGRVRQYGRAEGLSHTSVYAFHHDRWGDIWVGGNGGLSRLRGDRFQTLSFRNEARDWPVASVMDDEAGNLWIGFAFFGFIRVGREDVARAMDNSAYPPRYRVYNNGYRAGYPDISNGNSTGTAASGALWFLSSRGVIVLDPRALGADQDAPPFRPRIEGVVADDRRYSVAAGSVLPPRTGRLQIDYTVVSLSSLDRIRFRYRLDGFDTNWVDGTGPRQASYTNLPPGSYRFRLQTSTNFASWNDAEAAWSFSIQPMFYQTRWFYGLCALALGLCSIGAWQLRVRHVRKELALVFGERLRLSREIHDTLLQSLFGIALQIDAASHDVDDPAAPLRLHLQRIRRQIEDFISEARQSIWDLRSPTLNRRDLVGALREMGGRLTSGKVPFELTVTGTPRRCTSKVETHVLRIGYEAVTNAVRHAEARRVEMAIEFDEEMLRLRVADDGQGFSGAPARDSGSSGHYGLMSMKERAADAGGRCTIESTPGSGVQVVAEFPISRSA